MENGLVVNDFKLFVKYKKNIIIGVTLLVTFTMIIFSLFTELRSSNGAEEIPETVEEAGDFTDSEIEELLNEDRENLSQNDLNAINDFLFEDAYAFRVYIENQDGSIFNRSNLMQEVFTSNQIINDFENQTGYNLDLIRDYFLDINYNSNNVTFTITVGAGDSEANAALSQALYDSFADNEIAILNEKVVFLFEEPQSIDTSEEVQELDIVETSTDNLLQTILISSLIGLFLGAGFGVVVAYLHSLVEKKINPLFNFNLKSGDVFINFSENTQSEDFINHELWHAIKHPTTNEKLILSQDEKLSHKLRELARQSPNFNGEIVEKTHQVRAEKIFDEIILITGNGKTDKKWYADQRNQVKVYNKPSKIIKL